MFSQNVAKITPPSYVYFRSNLPLAAPLNQWKGVYYFSGLSQRARTDIALRQRSSTAARTRAFDDTVTELIQRDAALGGQAPITRQQQVRHATIMASYGLVHQAAPHIANVARPYNNKERSKALGIDDYATLISAHSVPAVRQFLYAHTNALGNYDTALTLKLAGEHNGEARAAAARQLLEDVIAVHGNKVGIDANDNLHLINCFNALMEVFLTCGHSYVENVVGIYDALATHRVAPNAHTYALLTLALGLAGKIEEGQHVAHFALRGIDAAPYRALGGTGVDGSAFAHALLLGYREVRDFGACDTLWRELVDTRAVSLGGKATAGSRLKVSIRPDARCADMYLRSIIDHSYSRAADPQAKFSELSVVEAKKVPLVLAQMTAAGIPRSHLTPPVIDEVEHALRRFSLTRSRFYNWGRAVKQFDFIEFRRRNGFLYDIPEMMPTTSAPPTPRRLPWSDGVVTAAASIETREGIFEQQRPWETLPLQQLLFVNRSAERYDDTRSGDPFFNDSKAVHDRGVWAHGVPQTRYDALYGLARPEVTRLGIRRHISPTASQARTSPVLSNGTISGATTLSDEERAARDRALLQATRSTARRARHRAETAVTHRIPAPDV